MSKIKREENSLMKAIIDSHVEKPEPTKGMVRMEIADPYPSNASSDGDTSSKLMKSFLNVLSGPGQTIERLAFDEDPDHRNQYQTIFKSKIKLLPDELLKRISIQDDLVAAIVHARSCMLAAFGRPQPDRYSTGYKIEPEPGLLDKLSDGERKNLQARIAKAEALILTCGRTTGYKDNDSMDFGQFLAMTTRDAVTVGRIAIEIIQTGAQSDKKFHSFRPVDAGTIYYASPHRNEADTVRKEALALLEQIKNKKLIPEKFINDEYAFIQVIRSRPRQAFTPDECLVHNFYPSTQIELNNYPITPIDTVISAVTTHINITTHNKLYFQNGRAARGMLVIRSEAINKDTISAIRQQFNASINGVSGSWRMPIFGVGQDDEINWMPIDNSSRDMEFQYLSDSNARTILSAFQMSPEELPGYAHLSRGANSQALSEGSNEYKLEAARDVGLRPIISHFQNFINSRILPLIDKELSKIASFKFVGLDAETAEKEAARIGAEVNLHLTMDDILEKVQKKPIGEGLGGKILLNPSWQQAIAPYLHVGYIREHVFGVKGAAQDPEFMYCRDPFWMQYQQMRMQIQQAQQQASTPQQPQQGQDQQGQQPQDQQGQEQQDQQQDLSTGIDQASNELNKGELELPRSKRQLVLEQKKIIQHFMDGWEKDSAEAIADIVKTAKIHVKKKK